MLSVDNLQEINDIITDYAEQLEVGDLATVYSKLDNRQGTLLAEFFLSDAKLDLMLLVKQLTLKMAPIINVSAENNGGLVIVPENCVVEKGAFYKTQATKVIISGSAVLSPDSFNNAVGLQSVELRNEIQRIPVGCFKGCASLKEVKLPSTLKIIDSEAFMGCTALPEINIPKSIKGIGVKVFWESPTDAGEMPNVFFEGGAESVRKTKMPEDERAYYEEAAGVRDHAKDEVPSDTSKKDTKAFQPSNQDKKDIKVFKSQEEPTDKTSSEEETSDENNSEDINFDVEEEN